MKKTRFLLLLIFTLVTISEIALARKHKAKAYSYFEDNAKVSQGECDGEGKIPSRMKRLKNFSTTKEYLGSEMQESDVVWKHFFKTQVGCNQQLNKVRSQ